MPLLSLYAHKHVKNPHDEENVVFLEDLPETWEQLLSDPQVINDDDKSSAPVLCGAEYFEGSCPTCSNAGIKSCRHKENVKGVGCLVLDVDCPETPSGTVPDEENLRAALAGLNCRFVVYTSPSHTADQPRWRVLVPMLTLLPAKKHRALVQLFSEALVPGFPGCISVKSTGDPCRLGFVGVTKHPEDYKWWNHPGRPFDWTAWPLDDEAWVQGPRGSLERSPLWTDRETALKAALKHFAVTGQGMRAGGGRSDTLWRAANHVWWAYAAEDDDFVLTVLRQINNNFADPEDEEDLFRKIDDTHKRTIGEGRTIQGNGTYGWAREPTNAVSAHAIDSHARKLKQRRNPELSLIGEALRRMLKNETLADEVGAWRGLITKCAHEVARAFPSETAERLASYFRASLATMRAKGASIPTDDEVQNFIATRLEGMRRQREENRARADAEERDRIDFVTNGERSSKYTKQEVEAWEGIGLRKSTWILVNKSAFYVFRNGTWVGPYTEKEFEANGYKDLAAATGPGVDIRTQTFSEKTGTLINVPLSKLLHDYGSKCTTRMDMNCDKTWFDVEEHVLVLAGPPRRALDPKFHPEIDQWLRVMCGRPQPPNEKVRQLEAATVGEADDYDALCDWLACVLQLDRPCAALYLQGVNSAGKGLLMEGVARIWKHGPISLEDAFDTFNSMLAETPFIWIDEALPEHVRASVLLRKALAAREFVFKEKYMNATKLLGCLRMGFTANNLELFNKSKEMVKKEDVDALAQRFVHIHVREEAVAFLESINPRHEAFVEKNMLAEHTLWLNEKRWPAIKARGYRFLVKGRNTSVSDVVATNSDATSDCCSAICEALSEGRGTDWLVVRNGEILVNASGLRRFLSIQQTNVRHTERDIARAITSIRAGDSRVVHNTKLRKPIRARPVRLVSLRAWCENTLVFEWADVQAGLDKLDKERQADPAAVAAMLSANDASASSKIVN